MPFELPVEQVSFVALDLETTGLAPGFDRITEVGLARFVVRRDGSVVAGERFQTLVDPARPIPVPIQRLTGIDDELVAGAPVLATAWPRIHSFLAAETPTVVVAHNARFDLAFLVAAAHELGLAWEPPPLVCTVDLARAWLPDAPRYALSALVEWMRGGGATELCFHRALADALHARNVFARCVGGSGARSLRELGVREGVPVPSPEDFEIDVPERLAPLAACIEAQDRVAMVYRGGSKGRSERPITPLAFYKCEGVLYLRGWCHLDDVAKSFRCDRIKRLTL